MARIARLFVPLDVEFATDDKIIAAGPLAGYLYVCSLAYAKRSGKEGFIHASQVQFLAPGLTKQSTHAQRLADVGLWAATDGGWTIAAWSRHNLSGDQLAERKNMQRAKAIAGNHQRHHVAKNVIEPECELCQNSPHGEPSKSPRGDGMVPRDREGRGIEKGEEEEEEEGAAPDSPTGDKPIRLNAAAAALNMLIDHKSASANDPAAWKRSMSGTLRDENRHALGAYLNRRPSATAEELAVYVLHVPGVSAQQSDPLPDWYADPNCEHCPGDGIARLDDIGKGTFGACPCRRAEPYPEPPNSWRMTRTPAA